MTIRTIDHLDQWNDFRTNDPSDHRPVGLLTIRTSARFSDQWTVGPTTIRNIELSPGGPVVMRIAHVCVSVGSWVGATTPWILRNTENHIYHLNFLIYGCIQYKPEVISRSNLVVYQSAPTQTWVHNDNLRFYNPVLCFTGLLTCSVQAGQSDRCAKTSRLFQRPTLGSSHKRRKLGLWNSL